MEWPLFSRIPAPDLAQPGTILDRFLDFTASKNLELYPAQEEAILALLDDKNVILNTPTGSGKSLVALALHFQSLSLKRRSYYTCPIKALVNEKFRSLCADFGPERVGMITGDGSVNANAPIICCTAEILSNLALREGKQADVQDVIMDEFHYYSDRQRGVAWQIPLLSMPQTRFLLMSATLGSVDFFAKELTRLNGKTTELILSKDRPVPLDFQYAETMLHETISDLVKRDLAPIYLVNFSQREAAEEAQNLLSVDFSTKEEKKKILEALEGTKFQSPYGKDIQRLLKHGIGLHHAGLLPKYRVLVEKLAQQGLLKVISGTDTLGVGVNVPIRTVLLTKLAKFDGEKSGILSVREFHQISGRAGRRGFDTRGNVVAQAPEHVIENLKQKAKDDGKKKKAKTAPQGFVMWTKENFQKLIESPPEALQSRFQITHSMLLQVLARADGVKAMKQLIKNSHGTPGSKKMLRKHGFTLFRSLLDRKIIEFEWSATSRYPRLRISAGLQEDFSVNQSLSLYLVDTIALLDPLSATYALDVLTLVESILEDPDLILRKQLDRVKTERMQELKMQGMEYDDRIAELEKCEYPKPQREFIYGTYNAFREAHPWVGEENIRPKSIAREMFENFHSFAEYIREYNLQRVEGLLLRYLSETYKVLEQNVPDAAKNEELREMALYFSTMVREVDSSLLDDWMAMQRGKVSETKLTEPMIPRGPSEKEITRLLRNEVHRFLRALAKKDFDYCTGPQWDIAKLESTMKEYELEHGRLRTDPKARHPSFTKIRKLEDKWEIEQVLLDPAERNDWQAKFLAQFLEKEEIVKLSLEAISPI